MKAKWQAVRQEIGPMARLAGPIVAAELGWMLMSIVDTMMVGRLEDSAAAIGAVGLGAAFFFPIAMTGAGLLLGLDTLVSQAFGAGRVDDCHHSLLNGVYLALALTPLLMGAVFAMVLPGASMPLGDLRSELFQRYGLDWELGVPPGGEPPGGTRHAASDLIRDQSRS